MAPREIKHNNDTVKTNQPPRGSRAVGTGETPPSLIAPLLENAQNHSQAARDLAAQLTVAQAPRLQRQALATELQRVKGNQFVQRTFLQRDDERTSRSDHRSRERQRREIESDRRRRREPGQGSGHLDSDWAGRAILHRYLTGGGDWTINNDAAWTEYMQNNASIRDECHAQLLGEARQMAFNNATTHTINSTFHMAVENGEGIIGYQYLHGTNANAGDFHMQGTMTRTPSATGDRFTANVTYTWNDIIDPNPQYATDNVKSMFAELITLGQAEGYNIHINWTAEGNFQLSADGSSVANESGWPTAN